MTHLCSLFPDALKEDEVRKCARQLHLGILDNYGIFFPHFVVREPRAPVHAKQVLAH